MDIDWYGHSCFRLRERGVTVVCDPYSKESTGLALPKIRADIVTISRALPDRDDNVGKLVAGEPKVLHGPGDYEVRQVLVTGLPTSHNGRRNVAFFLGFGGLTVGHLGELGQAPSQRLVEELGDIDVLLAPVSGPQTPDVSRIAEVISLLDPRIVVPMHYVHETLQSESAESPEPVARFLTELGISDPEVTDTLKLTKHGLSEETQVVLLRPNASVRPVSR